MDDGPDVGLVDAHPERARRRDHAGLVAEPPPLRGLADVAVETGVVGLGRDAVAPEPGRDGLGRPPRAGVDQSRTGHGPEHVERLPDRVLHVVDAPHEVGPVEPPHDDGRVAERQLLQNVAADLGRRRRGHGHDGRRVAGRGREERAGLGDLAVGRAEVVAPLRDAVGLVDRQQVDVEARGPGGEQVGLEPLRREVDEPVQPVLGVDPHLVRLAAAEAGVERGGADAAAGERVHLVLHQRHERRDDEGEPAPGDRRHLVHERLPAAGREDRQHVAAGERRRDGLVLAGPERAVAPRLPQGPERVVGDLGGHAASYRRRPGRSAGASRRAWKKSWAPRLCRSTSRV